LGSCKGFNIYLFVYPALKGTPYKFYNCCRFALPENSPYHPHIPSAESASANPLTGAHYFDPLYFDNIIIA
jgi:hypothetical protein